MITFGFTNYHKQFNFMSNTSINAITSTLQKKLNVHKNNINMNEYYFNNSKGVYQ